MIGMPAELNDSIVLSVNGKTKPIQKITAHPPTSYHQRFDSFVSARGKKETLIWRQQLVLRRSHQAAEVVASAVVEAEAVQEEEE